MFGFGRDPRLTGNVGSPEQTDNERRLADVVKTGRVVEVDYPKSRVRVGIGDPADAEGYITTGWLPMAGGRRDEWNPLKVGEAVTVISEGGELQNGVVTPGSIYGEGNPAPGDRGDLWRKKFDDGTVMEYDEAAKAFKIGGADGATLKMTVGDATLTVQDGSIVLTAGGQTLTVGGSGAVSSGKIKGDGGLEITGAPFTHNGKDVGDTHRHTNSGGPSTGGVPV